MTEARILLQAFCGYPTWVNDDHKYRQDDWDARYVVKAVKGDEAALAKGYVKIGKPQRLFNRQNYPALVDAVGKWLAQRLECGPERPVVLAAIPNSHATAAIADFPTAVLVKNIAAHAGEHCTPYTGLRFKTAMEKSHDHGSRDPRVILSALTMITPPPPGEIVLFDDVCTKGAHLFAAQRFFNERQPARAITYGRTYTTPPEKMLELDPEILTMDW